MNLNQSVFCPNCEEIFEQERGVCPKCGSAQFVHLRIWMQTVGDQALAGITGPPTIKREEDGIGTARWGA